MWLIIFIGSITLLNTLFSLPSILLHSFNNWTLEVPSETPFSTIDQTISSWCSTNWFLIEKITKWIKTKADPLTTTSKTSASKSAGSGGRRILVAAPLPPPPSPPGGRKGSENRTELRKEAQDAINLILPPKEWTEEGQTWRQLVQYLPFLKISSILG